MRVNLEDKWMVLESKLCVMCGVKEETTNHLFFKCKIVWMVWSRSNQWLGEILVNHGEVINHFFHFYIRWTSKKANSVWESMWIAVMVEI